MCGPAQCNRYSNLLQPGQSRDRILVGVRYSAPVQNGPGGHPASYTMGTGSFTGVKRPGRGYTSTTTLGLRGLFEGEFYLLSLPLLYDDGGWPSKHVEGITKLYLCTYVYCISVCWFVYRASIILLYGMNVKILPNLFVLVQHTKLHGTQRQISWSELRSQHSFSFVYIRTCCSNIVTGSVHQNALISTNLKL